MSYPIGLQVLRAKIRGFQSTGATISARITKSEKDRKNRLWNQKRALGSHCRAHLVAYGLLRGVPYDQIERCAPNNKLSPKVVLAIMEAHNGWDSKRGYVKYDLEMVEKLLDGAVGRWEKQPNAAPKWVVEKPASSETGNAQESPTAASAPDARPNTSAASPESGSSRWLTKLSAALGKKA